MFAHNLCMYIVYSMLHGFVVEPDPVKVRTPLKGHLYL